MLGVGRPITAIFANACEHGRFFNCLPGKKPGLLLPRCRRRRCMQCLSSLTKTSEAAAAVCIFHYLAPSAAPPPPPLEIGPLAQSSRFDCRLPAATLPS